MKPPERDDGQSPVSPSIDPDTLSDEAFVAYLAGLRNGYDQGVAVLRETAERLARCRPLQVIADAEARARRDTYSTPGLSADELRQRAAESWGFAEPQIEQRGSAR